MDIKKFLSPSRKDNIDHELEKLIPLWFKTKNLPVEQEWQWTFNDVTIGSQKSDVLPIQADVSTMLAYGPTKIKLNIPIISAAMDTVTDSRLAIMLAMMGGCGIIHRNMEIHDQTHEVEVAKRAANYIITNPITVKPTDTIGYLKEKSDQYVRENLKDRTGKVIGMPVLNKTGKLVGIITNRNVRKANNDTELVRKYMTRKNLLTAPPEITEKETIKLMDEREIEKILVVDDKEGFIGMITRKDIEKRATFPDAAIDKKGRYLVGAAVGVGDKDISRKRAGALVEAGVDVIVLDSAHAHHYSMSDILRALRGDSHFNKTVFIAGNITTARGAYDLVEAGADAVKVGQGPGKTCTTRTIAGVGYGQITATALAFVGKEYARHNLGIERDIPLITDGGLENPCDVAKSITSGADLIMTGSMFAGTDEAPGSVQAGKKAYRGMGSLDVMMETLASDRYLEQKKHIAEGASGVVEHKGPLRDVVNLLTGALTATMGYTGCKNIKELKRYGVFRLGTSALQLESQQRLEQLVPSDVQKNK